VHLGDAEMDLRHHAAAAAAYTRALHNLPAGEDLAFRASIESSLAEARKRQRLRRP
jgi:hypothetical protein